MHIRQTNSLKMVQATLGCLQDNAKVWTGITGIEEAKESTGELVAAILKSSLKQSSLTGVGALKAEARTEMLRTAYTVCSALKAFASATENSQLFAQANFSRSSIARGREADVINRCQSLLALGNTNAEALAEKYDVGNGDLKALKLAIEEFSSTKTKPRQHSAAKAAATAELADLFAQVEKVLKEQLDPLIDKFETRNPSFYTEYQTARGVVHSAASHETSADNGAPAEESPVETPAPAGVA